MASSVTHDRDADILPAADVGENTLRTSSTSGRNTREHILPGREGAHADDMDSNLPVTLEVVGDRNRQILPRLRKAVGAIHRRINVYLVKWRLAAAERFASEAESFDSGQSENNNVGMSFVSSAECSYIDPSEDDSRLDIEIDSTPNTLSENEDMNFNFTRGVKENVNEEEYNAIDARDVSSNLESKSTRSALGSRSDDSDSGSPVAFISPVATSTTDPLAKWAADAASESAENARYFAAVAAKSARDAAEAASKNLGAQAALEAAGSIAASAAGAASAVVGGVAGAVANAAVDNTAIIRSSVAKVIAIGRWTGMDSGSNTNLNKSTPSSNLPRELPIIENRDTSAADNGFSSPESGVRTELVSDFYSKDVGHGQFAVGPPLSSVTGEDAMLEHRGPDINIILPSGPVGRPDTEGKLPTTATSMLMRSDEESAEWLNMLLRKAWKIYQEPWEQWVIQVLQPAVDKLIEDNYGEWCPSYVQGVDIEDFFLGEKPLWIPAVRRMTSRKISDVIFHLSLRYAGPARMSLRLRLGTGPVQTSVPVIVESVDLEAALWVRIRLGRFKPYLPYLSVSLLRKPRLGFDIRPLGSVSLMRMPGVRDSLRYLIADLVPGLFTMPKRINLDFTPEAGVVGAVATAAAVAHAAEIAKQGHMIVPFAAAEARKQAIEKAIDFSATVPPKRANLENVGPAEKYAAAGRVRNSFAGVLHVTLFEARGLPSSGFMFWREVYNPKAILDLGGQVLESMEAIVDRGKRAGGPSVQKGEAVWNQYFELLVPFEAMEAVKVAREAAIQGYPIPERTGTALSQRSQRLRIRVRNSPSTSAVRADLFEIGECEIDLSTLEEGVPLDLWLSLRASKQETGVQSISPLSPDGKDSAVHIAVLYKEFVDEFYIEEELNAAEASGQQHTLDSIMDLSRAVVDRAGASNETNRKLESLANTLPVLAIKAAASAAKSTGGIDKQDPFCDNDYAGTGPDSEDFYMVGQSGDAMADGNYQRSNVVRSELSSQNTLTAIAAAAMCGVILGASGITILREFLSH